MVYYNVNWCLHQLYAIFVQTRYSTAMFVASENIVVTINVYYYYLLSIHSVELSFFTSKYGIINYLWLNWLIWKLENGEQSLTDDNLNAPSILVAYLRFRIMVWAYKRKCSTANRRLLVTIVIRVSGAVNMILRGCNVCNCQEQRVILSPSPLLA